MHIWQIDVPRSSAQRWCIAERIVTPIRRALVANPPQRAGLTVTAYLLKGVQRLAGHAGRDSVEHGQEYPEG